MKRKYSPSQNEKYYSEYWLKRKEFGMRAFVARKNTGLGADRSVVLIGPDDRNQYIQAVKFWHGDHAQRAALYVAEYNAKVVPEKKGV